MFCLNVTLNFQVLKVINSKISHNAKYSNTTDNDISTDFSPYHHVQNTKVILSFL